MEDSNELLKAYARNFLALKKAILEHGEQCREDEAQKPPSKHSATDGAITHKEQNRSSRGFQDGITTANNTSPCAPEAEVDVALEKSSRLLTQEELDRIKQRRRS